MPLQALLAGNHMSDEWRGDERKRLEYARRLRFTDPKLALEIICDVLDSLLRHKETPQDALESR